MINSGAWVAGSNMAGFLPDSDPTSFLKREDAADYVTDAMRDWAEEDDTREFERAADFGEVAEASSVAAVESLTAEDGPASVAGDWSYTIIANDGMAQAFWIQWEPTAIIYPDDPVVLQCGACSADIELSHHRYHEGGNVACPCGESADVAHAMRATGCAVCEDD